MVARRVVAGVVLVVLATLGWLLLAPQQLGGPVAVVSTFGTSMLPTYAASDLVVVARASSYELGDVVAYRSEELGGTVVLHRIVDQDAEGYVTQGDNNDWLDPDRPTDDELMGTARLHIPGAGRILDLPAPVRAASVTALAALALFGGRTVRRRRVRPPTPETPRVQLLPTARRRRTRRRARADDTTATDPRFAWFGWPLQTALVAAVVGVLAIVLAAAAFSRPATAPGELTYTHRGQFTYTADAPTGVVYPDGAVATGDPVFVRLVDRLDVAFAYEFVGPDSAVEPTGQLWIELADGTGWSSRTALGGPQVADDGQLQLEGTLDISRLQRTLDQVRAQTGGGGGEVTITAEVTVGGAVAGQPLADRFAPTLAFQLGEHRLVADESPGTTDADEAADDEPTDDGSAADADEAVAGYVRTEGGAVPLPDTEPARIGFAGREVDVAAARVLGLVLLGAALVALVVAAVGAARQGELDDATRIARRYHRRLVEVAALEIPAGYGLIDVRDVDTLVALADRNERPVLHHRTDEADTYLVEGDASVYRYRTASS